MKLSVNKNSDFLPSLGHLVAEYQNLPVPTRIRLPRQTRDVRNEWCLFLVQLPLETTSVSRVALVFSIIDILYQPPICMPLKALRLQNSPIEECPLDLIAAGIFRFFTSGIVKALYETEEPVAPFSLSCSDETLAGLLTVLFCKAGLPKDRRVNVSNPRVSLECLARNTSGTVMNSWDRNYQTEELKQLLLCTCCLGLFVPGLGGLKCEDCGYRSYCGQQCKNFQRAYTKNHLPPHQSECQNIRDILGEIGGLCLQENYIYLGEDAFKKRFPLHVPDTLTTPSVEDIFVHLFPLLGRGAGVIEDKIEEETTENGECHGTTNCEIRWLKALEDLDASEDDFSNLWEPQDPGAICLQSFPIELFLLKS